MARGLALSSSDHDIQILGVVTEVSRALSRLLVSTGRCPGPDGGKIAGSKAGTVLPYRSVNFKSRVNQESISVVNLWSGLGHAGEIGDIYFPLAPSCTRNLFLIWWSLPPASREGGCGSPLLIRSIQVHLTLLSAFFKISLFSDTITVQYFIYFISYIASASRQLSPTF